MNVSPFSKDFVGSIATKFKPVQLRKPKTNQPPKNARTVLQQDPPMKLAKLRRGSL